MSLLPQVVQRPSHRAIVVEEQQDRQVVEAVELPCLLQILM
jgi:hypothetical protein